PSSPLHTTKTRLIIRNMTGKYCWDCSLFFESLLKAQNSEKADTEYLENQEQLGVSASHTLSENVSVDSIPKKPQMERVLYIRDPKTAPIYEPETFVETAD
ncbi:hypothetical protein HK096_001563, partial [Nowakowskiella sp. JEL0078]